MYWSVAHEGTGGDQLVLLVHVALADTLAHVLAAQLVDGRGGVSSVGVPKTKGKKEAPMCCCQNSMCCEIKCAAHTAVLKD